MIILARGLRSFMGGQPVGCRADGMLALEIVDYIARSLCRTGRCLAAARVAGFIGRPRCSNGSSKQRKWVRKMSQSRKITNLKLKVERPRMIEPAAGWTRSVGAWGIGPQAPGGAFSIATAIH